MAPDPHRSRAHLLRHPLAALVALLALVCAGLPAVADSFDDQKNQAQQQQDDIQRQQEENDAALEDTEAALVEAKKQLDAITAQIPGAQQALDAASAAFRDAQAKADDLADQLDVARAQESALSAQLQSDEQTAARLKQALGELARDTYRGGAGSGTLGLLLGASTSDDFLQRYEVAGTAMKTQSRALRDLEQVMASNRNVQARLDAVRGDIDAKKTEADAAAKAADDARADAERNKATLDGLQADAQHRKDDLDAQKAQQLALDAQLDAEAKELTNKINEIIAAQRAAAAAAGKPSTPGQALGRGFLNYPVASPVVTSPYGWRLHPIYGYYRLHAGTDFRAACGIPIMAAADGEVVWATMKSGAGNQVLLDHGLINGNSVMTVYDHMSSFAVSKGQSVTQGQVIGYAGTTGTSTACHLHFEVHINGDTVDPMSVL